MHSTSFDKSDLPQWVEDLVRRTIGLAIEAHRGLGRGLLEGVYEDAICIELADAGIAFERQAERPVMYKGRVLRTQRLDILIAGTIIVEAKSVETILPVHRAQVLSYLRATRLPIGLLINFNVDSLRGNIHRIFNPGSSLVEPVIKPSLSSSFDTASRPSS